MKYTKYIAAALGALLLAGCAENPDSGIVVHKDMEKVISEAENSAESRVDLSAMQTDTETERYTADVSSDRLRVYLKANAPVNVPQTDALSLLRVQQHMFSQEEVDRIRKAFMGDAAICDWFQFGNIVPRVRLEEALRIERESLAKHLDQLQNDAKYAEDWESGVYGETADEATADMQAKIDKAQKKYEEAPAVIDYSAYPADGKLRTKDELVAINPDPDFVPAMLRHLGDAELLSVMSADGKMCFSVRNSENICSEMRFETNPVGVRGYALVGSANDKAIKDTIQKPTADMPEMPGETCNLSMEDAQKIAEDFMQQIGVTDYMLSEGDKYDYFELCNVLQETDGAEEERHYARTCYILRYGRAIGGVLVDQSGGKKSNDNDIEGHNKEDAFTLKEWPNERMEFRINDSGIVYFQWLAPLEVTETVVDNAQMKPFSEISAIFERMLPVVMTNDVPDYKTDVNINDVTLRYSRLSEKDDFVHGLIVPVWAFSGSRRVYTDDGYVERMQTGSGIQLAINAIDGSVIDAELGY